MKISGKKEGKGEVKLLTSCPACLQGLSRYEDETGAEAAFLVVEMARHYFGEDWQQAFPDKIQKDGIERVLL